MLYILGLLKTYHIKFIILVFGFMVQLIDLDILLLQEKVIQSLEENFPTANLESLACGTPVITFNTGGSIETIDDTTGFIVKKGDIKNTIRIIRKIKSEGKEKYSESCIKRANKYYNKDDKFQEYIKLYESLGNKVEL